VVEDVWGRDVRFSPDGRRLVALVGPEDRRDDLDVVLVDLESGDDRTLGRLDGIRWIRMDGRRRRRAARTGTTARARFCAL